MQEKKSPYNVLYISYDGMTDPLGQSQVIPYLKGLSLKGFSITIISFEKGNNFLKEKNLIEELLKSSKIVWHPISYTKKPLVVSTVWDIYRMIRKAKEIIQKENIQIVHCRSYIAALAGQYLKKKFGLKFIFDMRGFWADERVDGKLWNLKNPVFKKVYSFFKNKEKEFLKEADHIVSLTQSAKTEITSWPSLEGTCDKIEVIPCCADLQLFSYKSILESDLSLIKEYLKIEKDTFVLSYLGSIGTWYMLNEMMMFFKMLNMKNANSRFLFITHDAPNQIISSAESHGINKELLIIKKASRKEVPLYLKLSSASIFFIKPYYSKIASSPTKMAEILGMGIPVIANKGVGDSDLFLKEKNIGILLEDFSEKSYLKAIEKIKDLMSVSLEERRDVAVKNFSLEKGIERYYNVYMKVLKERGKVNELTLEKQLSE